MGKLSMGDIFYSQITGKLLGDGCITHQTGRQPRFQFMHRTEDLGWSHYCYDQLKTFLPLNSPVYKYVPDARMKNGFTECYVVQSRTSPLITELETLWYKARQKRLPFSFILDHFTSESLAWWYQDDGHLMIKGNIVKKIILSTDSFSVEERFFLKELLYQRFQLDFKIDGQKRLLLYDQRQIYAFLTLIQPFLQPCMQRKQRPVNKITAATQPKRTTVYLPEKLNLTKPTSQINSKLQVKLPILINLVEGSKSMIELQERLLPTIQPTKSYQIVLSAEILFLIDRIQQLTGWKKSEVASTCFYL